MSVSFTVIVPTCGRWSLQRTLRSIREQQLRRGDEVLVVTDGPQELAKDQFGRSNLPGACLEAATTHDLGASQRNHGMDLAHGDYLLFMDDDDSFAPGAFAAIRAAVMQAPGRPHLFRMRFARDGKVLWRERKVQVGNLGTPMIVFPNRPSRLARWTRSVTHDYRFVAESLALWPPEALVWRDEVIAVIRPHEAAAPVEPVSRRLTVEECPHRHSVRRKGGTEKACCRVLQEVSGIKEPSWCSVRRDACTACCASFLPSAEEINPVVASLLFDITSRVCSRGGVPGCNTGKAEELRFWAEQALELEPAPSDPPVRPRRSTEPCSHLGPVIGGDSQSSRTGLEQVRVFACRHPNHGRTTEEECRRCRDWSTGAAAVAVPLREVLPSPAPRKQPRIGQWSVGVTTAPRAQPTLGLCLDSLFRAGWESARLFMDGEVAVPERHASLPMTRHESKLGAWPNYYLALIELLMRQPQADAYLLVQDDVIFYDREDLRAYLEHALWPSRMPGAVSLFCPSG
ncbi:MAG TPA: glycosyltransferase family A protein, partial [Gemmataceae bacterium]|nr:glycosyltransferase family A protein [Gemmataceae bacterium]